MDVWSQPDGSRPVEPIAFLIERRGSKPEVTIGVGGPHASSSRRDRRTIRSRCRTLSNLDAPYTFFQVGVGAAHTSTLTSTAYRS
jgi:hypothetical protein